MESDSLIFGIARTGNGSIATLKIPVWVVTIAAYVAFILLVVRLIK